MKRILKPFKTSFGKIMTTKQQLLQYAHLWKTLAWPGFWLKMAEPHVSPEKPLLKTGLVAHSGKQVNWARMVWLESTEACIQCFWRVGIKSGEGSLFLSNWQVQSGCLVNAHPGAQFFSPSRQVWFSKDGSQTCSLHSTWGLARNANSQFAPWNYWTCISRVGPRKLTLSRWLWGTLVWEPLT